jgi:hypothetical protein
MGINQCKCRFRSEMARKEEGGRKDGELQMKYEDQFASPSSYRPHFFFIFVGYKILYELHMNYSFEFVGRGEQRSINRGI